MATTADHGYMSLALNAAEEGYSTPNPHVGCVIVQEGVVVGIGTSEPAGGRHAEVVALEEAGPKAHGATAYVTLEPCNHFGKTPPCTQALIDAGIQRVVIATRDPNPKASGGIERLEAAGIAVEVGVNEKFAREQMLQFFFAVEHQRPMVTVKAGISLDGRIALPSGESQWITGATSRMDAHLLRAECGCVLVGRATAELDRARLTARHALANRQPTRVVIDPQGKLADSLPIFSDEAPTIRYSDVVRNEWDQPLPRTEEGQTDLHALLADLFQRGETGVLVEGGGKTIAEFFRAKLVDRIILYVAPMILGEGATWTQSFGLEHLDDAPKFVEIRQHLRWRSTSMGEDRRMVYHSQETFQFLNGNQYKIDEFQ